MDRLVLMVAGASKGIRKIRAERVVNSSERRLPLQKKTGAGMSLQEFEESYGKGIVRHVGLLESVKMISDGLGLEIDEIKEEVEPVIAEHDVQSRQIKAEKGNVSGIRQISQGMKNGEAIITLELKMHLGAEAYDRIEIEGEPSICLKISNGIHGDLATTAIIVNSIPGVISARPGLLTVKDMI
jgi:4-hydroxy-tetrahydrodipicolinate reductase